MASLKLILIVPIMAAVAIFAAAAGGQSRHSVKADNEGTVISLTLRQDGEGRDPVKREDLTLYENGVEQRILNLTYDPSPSRIVILADNSQTLAADQETLKKAVMEFAYEIFEGDQLFVLAYDEKAEIIQEWTDDAKKIEQSLASFRKKGNPFLFDALSDSVTEVLLPLMPGTRKTAVVIIGDGLDRGSKTSFDKLVGMLQNRDITVYALQLPDRTGGAFRRGQPKAAAVINQLTTATGGRAFPLEEAQTAAKAICEELRKDRYLLSYNSQNTSTYDHRQLFVIGKTGMEIRTKAAQPPNVK